MKSNQNSFISPNYHVKLQRDTRIESVRNHVKLEICSFVMNSGGFSLRILYCVVDASYGLGRPLGDCRPALLKVPNG